MTKRTITITWLTGIGVMIVGGLVVLFTGLALASHIGSAIYNLRLGVNYVPDSTFWGLVSLILLGVIVVFGGLITQFVAWIGAVINTNLLVDKTWFNIMLWIGIAAVVLTFITGGIGSLIGWGLMIVYLIGGPDGTAMEPMVLRTTPVEPPRPLAPTG